MKKEKGKTLLKVFEEAGVLEEAEDLPFLSFENKAVYPLEAETQKIIKPATK